MNLLKHIFWTFLLILYFQNTFGQDTFEPPVNHKKIHASKAKAEIVINGILNEQEWLNAHSISGFKQVEPHQGEPAVFDTEVKILFDDKYLYIGVYNKDSLGAKGFRTPNLIRDFSFENNDLFGVAIDPFNTRRNAVAFQVTPQGTQRDLQAFDDAIFDVDWDALWLAKTSVSDSGWYAEIAIPFNTIRFPKSELIENDSLSWGINFVRVHRRSNEISAFPGYPRSVNTYRMTYIADLRGLDLPPSGNNVRINPYVVRKINAVEGEQFSYSTKFGGDLKWGITEHSTIDLSVNTDFAQADVDRQVINLTRFSVYFPERRQFFLENSGLFIVGDAKNLQPFFSRRIGLDGSGNPIPLIIGTRYTDRTISRSIGALYALQDNNDALANSHFGLVRYIKNYGAANNIGIMLSSKYESGSSNNTVGTINGVSRFNEKLSLKYMWSNSIDRSDTKSKIGSGSNINLTYISNSLYFATNHTLISKQYDSKIGFISRGDLLAHNIVIVPIIRPSWRPKFLRSYQPGVVLELAQGATDLQMQEGALNIFPIYFIMNNGGNLTFRYQYNWQILDTEFSVLGVPITPGNYLYSRYRINYHSDLSQKLSFKTGIETGEYYNGSLNSLTAEVNYAPISNIYFSNSYMYNKLFDINESENENITTHLMTSSLRLALNPDVQLVSFYQYNSVARSGHVNLRLSWQFKPLSYIYFIYNSNKNKLLETQEKQGIFKVNFTKQF